MGELALSNKNYFKFFCSMAWITVLSGCSSDTQSSEIIAKRPNYKYCVHNGKHWVVAFNVTEKLPESLDAPWQTLKTPMLVSASVFEGNLIIHSGAKLKECRLR